VRCCESGFRVLLEIELVDGECEGRIVGSAEAIAKPVLALPCS